MGAPVDEKRIFQYRFSEVLWLQLRAYVRNLTGLPLWVNHELSATVFGGKQTGEFWRPSGRPATRRRALRCSRRRST
jgi:hypothetical protein